MHTDRFAELNSVIFDRKSIGEIRQVKSAFHEPTKQGNIRLDPTLEPYGALGDLAWYTVRITLASFRYDLPDSVRCVGEKSNNGAIIAVLGWLIYDDGRTASFE